MKFESYDIVENIEDADDPVDLLYRQNHSGMKLTFKGKWSGVLKIKDRVTGKVVSESKEYDRNPTAFNGYNAVNGIVSLIIENDLGFMLMETKEHFNTKN